MRLAFVTTLALLFGGIAVAQPQADGRGGRGQGNRERLNQAGNCAAVPQCGAGNAVGLNARDRLRDGSGAARLQRGSRVGNGCAGNGCCACCACSGCNSRGVAARGNGQRAHGKQTGQRNCGQAVNVGRGNRLAQAASGQRGGGNNQFGLGNRGAQLDGVREPSGGRNGCQQPPAVGNRGQQNGQRRGGGNVLEQKPRGRQGNAPRGAVAPTAGKLADAEVRVLREALQEEYRAEAFYADALEAFGADRRFENLRRAEQNHIGAIEGLCEQYGVEMPVRSEVKRIEVPKAYADAVAAAAEFEADEGPLYDRLLKSVERDDIRTVFERLRDVSLTRHLPALQGEMPGPGSGRGRGAQ